MNLPPRTLVPKTLVVKEKTVLALDTGIEADSIEGLRLVKASRGTGWYYLEGTLRVWTTRGVLQENKKLVVWGDLDGPVPEVEAAGEWPRTGPGAREFLLSFVGAWTARAGRREPLDGFSPSALVPCRAGGLWGFLFPPAELKTVLDSLHPLADRLAWDHFRHPDISGTASWAFTTGALAVDGASGTLPWAQDDEAHLRQEIRDLKRTLRTEELPSSGSAKTDRLWYDSLTGRVGNDAAARWSAWAAEVPDPRTNPETVSSPAAKVRAAAKRAGRRARGAFWRRRGGLILGIGAGTFLILSIVGSVAWGLLKPDPTDTWSPEQVVRGYYQALDHLDTEQLRKLTSFDRGREPALGQDQDLVVNLYVIRQVRTGYEKKNPVVSASDWEAGGKAGLVPGALLFGVADLQVAAEGGGWTARYHLWETGGTEDSGPEAVGKDVVDHLGLVKTWKGWKVTSLARESKPLP